MSQLKVDSIIPVGGVATGQGGGIIQTIQESTTTLVSTTSTSAVDSTLSATITPTSTSSKILVFVSQQFRLRRTSGDSSGGSFILLRGSTTIHTGPGRYGIWFQAGGSSAIDHYQRWNIQVFDSPNTTSATTYKTQLTVHNSSHNLRAQPVGISGSGIDGKSYITLMEVSG
jgi:hypothetical protein